MEPLVSVIVPTYQRPKLLKETLGSIVSQTYSHLEILVIDDGTPGEENRQLCEAFPKIHYHKIENSGGPAGPRNTGAQMATGKYMAFIDDDDLWLPKKIIQQVHILEQNPDFGLVHTPCLVMDAQGVQTGELIGRPGSPNVKHGTVSDRMMGNWTLMTSSVLLRKEVFKMVGKFNENMPPAGEDTEFWNRCAFATKFYYLPEPLVYYRKHEGISHQLGSAYFELPSYLKKVLDAQLTINKIPKGQYQKLRNNLVRQQLKGMRKSGILKTLRRVFKLNPFWFLTFGNMKLFIKQAFNL